MADTCPNLLECCPKAIFIPPAPSIAGQLAGLLWVMPCTNSPVPPCFCVDPAPVVTVMQGTPGELYDVTLRIRGVVELNSYSGGAVVAGTGGRCYAGSTLPGGTINIYRLQISDPLQSFFLNNNAGFSPTIIVDYSFVVQINAGAIVTMTALSIDGVESPNQTNLIVPVNPGDPPIRVAQAYGGQFLQLDATSIA